MLTQVTTYLATATHCSSEAHEHGGSTSGHGTQSLEKSRRSGAMVTVVGIGRVEGT